MTPFSNHPHIEMVSHCSLRQNPDNPRKHNPEQIEHLMQSIRRWGFKGALIVDEDGLIVAGHAMWEAAGKCGLDEVPIIRASFLSEADRRAFALAHNRLAELSNWDAPALARELEFLFEADYDFSGTGFTTADLDLSYDAAADKGEPDVELPDLDAKAISRHGDLWIIGDQRLYCGNARDAASYEALLGDERAAMVFCDPPFNVKVDGHVSGLGKIKHREFHEASGEMDKNEFTAFLRAIFRMCVRFAVKGSIHYHCMDWRHMREMLDASDGVYTELKQLVVWEKAGSAGMGTFYRSQHELIFVFKSGRERHINNFGLGEKGRFRTNVWSHKGANTFRKGRADDLAIHPTCKPVSLVVDALLDCSNRGDLILDAFSGSGTTLLAAHRTRRRGRAIEIDPLYVDASLRRLHIATGIEPELPDGRNFTQVVAERAKETGDE